jgi:hypothetical protein
MLKISYNLTFLSASIRGKIQMENVNFLLTNFMCFQCLGHFSPTFFLYFRGDEILWITNQLKIY